MGTEGIKENKALYVLLSILAAVAIWVFVDNTEGYETSIPVADVPIEFTGENTTLADRGLMLLDDSQRTVEVVVEGKKSTLMRMDLTRLQVIADVSGITTTGRLNISCRVNYPASGKGDSNLNGSVSYKLKSYNVSINVGELYRKSVEVRCDIQGSVAENYIAGELLLEPAELQLRGLQEEVEQVSYAKVTLDIDNATETVTQTLSYKLYDKNDREVDSDNVHPVTSEILATLPVNVIKQLPLVIRFVESAGSRTENLDYHIEPTMVTVSGDAAMLRNVNAIVLEDDFDLTAVGSEEVIHHYQIVLPAGCENLSNVTRATLRIRFKDLVTETVSVDQIEYENAPQGKTVTVLTAGVPVILRGTSSDVEAVTAEDIRLVADLSTISSASGSYTVPVEVRLDAAGDIGIIGSYQIKVTVEDEPAGPEGPGPETESEDGI